MAVTVTNSTFTAFNTITTVTNNAATETGANTAEVFTITPTKADYKVAIIIGGTGSGASADIAFSFAAGDLWDGQAVTGTVTKNTEKMIEVEGGKVMQNDGTIALTLTPSSGDSLATTHSAYVKVIETL